MMDDEREESVPSVFVFNRQQEGSGLTWTIQLLSFFDGLDVNQFGIESFGS